MYKTVFLSLAAMLLIAAGAAIPPANSEEISGQALFRSLHCGGCHKIEGKGVGMDLKQIAQGYKAEAQRLNDYLAGKKEALLNPARARVMARQIKKTKQLSPVERQALAAYLLSFK
jgi:cytochrome c551/c552